MAKKKQVKVIDDPATVEDEAGLKGRNAFDFDGYGGCDPDNRAEA